jgi:hypothetical protein
MAFSPDGRLLATGHTDGTILLWDVPPARPAAVPSPAALWDDLAADAPRGYAAVFRCRTDPAASVRFLRQRLSPVRSSEAEVKGLIAKLDSDQFREREAASRRLEVLERVAEPALRKALQDQPAAEQQRRIETLLEVLARYDPPQGDSLRAVRAVAILEGINTAEAGQLLKEWAKGAPGAWLTEEARRALQRLDNRPFPSP